MQVDDVQTGVDRGLGQHHIGVNRCIADIGTVRLYDRYPLRCKVFRGVPAHLVIAVGGNTSFERGLASTRSAEVIAAMPEPNVNAAAAPSSSASADSSWRQVGLELRP